MPHTLIEDFGLGATKDELLASLRRLEAMDQDDLGVLIAIQHVREKLALNEKIERGEEIQGP